MTAEQSAATSTLISVDLGASSKAGAEGGTESAVSSEQEAALLDSMESDEEPPLASAKVGTSGATEAAVKRKATETPSCGAKKKKYPRS